MLSSKDCKNGLKLEGAGKELCNARKPEDGRNIRSERQISRLQEANVIGQLVSDGGQKLRVYTLLVLHLFLVACSMAPPLLKRLGRQ